MDLSGLWSRHLAGEDEARAALIESHAALATSIARSMRLPAGVLAATEDLESAAVIGLIQAIDRYDPARGVPFEAFAALRIRGAILDELRLVDDRTRAERRQEREGETELDALVLSLDRIMAAGGEGHFLADATLDERVDGAELRERLLGALDRLSTRQREVLARYYGDSLTLREAGKRMGISEARACQLHGRALDHLRRAFAASAA